MNTGVIVLVSSIVCSLLDFFIGVFICVVALPVSHYISFPFLFLFV